MKKKSKKNQLTKVNTVRLRADTFKKLEEIAWCQNISRTTLVRKILSDYIDAYE